MNKKIIGIIPARYKSSRFPGKPLTELLGKPMIIWVAELSANALGRENVYIATDDVRIQTVVEEYGFNVVMTLDTHPTGTDRLVEVSNIVDADMYINIQGDEPTLNPNEILKVVNEKLKYPYTVINAMTELDDEEDPFNVNIPKVVVNESMNLLYMSRLPVPGFKDISNKPDKYYKQVCIYAFTKDELNKYGQYGRKSTTEKHEDIEILRFLDIGTPVRMIIVEQGSYAVDTVGDIQNVENRLKQIHQKA